MHKSKQALQFHSNKIMILDANFPVVHFPLVLKNILESKFAIISTIQTIFGGFYMSRKAFFTSSDTANLFRHWKLDDIMARRVRVSSDPRIPCIVNVTNTFLFIRNIFIRNQAEFFFLKNKKPIRNLTLKNVRITSVLLILLHYIKKPLRNLGLNIFQKIRNFCSLDNLEGFL